MFTPPPTAFFKLQQTRRLSAMTSFIATAKSREKYSRVNTESAELLPDRLRAKQPLILCGHRAVTIFRLSRPATQCLMFCKKTAKRQLQSAKSTIFLLTAELTSSISRKTTRRALQKRLKSQKQILTDFAIQFRHAVRPQARH